MGVTFREGPGAGGMGKRGMWNSVLWPTCKHRIPGRVLGEGKLGEPPRAGP